MSKFYITTSIPYVNAAPHIGHALEFVQADVLARLARYQKKDVFFLSGTDDNALKNVQAAEAAGATPFEWVNTHAEIFRKLLGDLNISNDDFIRTSVEERHIKGAQKLWGSCKKEDIYKKKYQGLYCLGCEEFKREKDLVNSECPEHPGKKLEIVEEENYFFKLSNYQKQLEDILEQGKIQIIPDTRKNEILSFVREGLEDFSISRSRERAKNWGVSVLGDGSQVMYVWFDALSNYINALGYADNSEKFLNFWENGNEIIHLIGKGITRFHAIYWPAMLLSAGIALPKTIFVHGYLTIGGAKISKTVGNIIDPFELVQKYGTDTVRYFLLREIPSAGDGDFSYEKLEERYNGDLANGIGNFAARVLTLGSQITDLQSLEVESEVAEKIENTKKMVTQKISEFKLHEALVDLWALIHFGDQYVNEKKPWSKDLAENDKRSAIYNVIVILDNIAVVLLPFLPETSKKITENIKWEGGVLKIKKGEVLFPRLQ